MHLYYAYIYTFRKCLTVGTSVGPVTICHQDGVMYQRPSIYIYIYTYIHTVGIVHICTSVALSLFPFSVCVRVCPHPPVHNQQTSWHTSGLSMCIITTLIQPFLHVEVPESASICKLYIHWCSLYSYFSHPLDNIHALTKPVRGYCPSGPWILSFYCFILNIDMIPILLKSLHILMLPITSANHYSLVQLLHGDYLLPSTPLPP
jgi:hypothetical protein